MGEQLLGLPGLPVLTTVEHSCRHKVRWHFFGRLTVARDLAANLPCPRCSGEAPGGPCDAIYHPTGVAHLHPGRCPDAAPDVQRWLHGVGARI